MHQWLLSRCFSLYRFISFCPELKRDILQSPPKYWPIRLRATSPVVASRIGTNRDGRSAAVRRQPDAHFAEQMVFLRKVVFDRAVLSEVSELLINIRLDLPTRYETPVTKVIGSEQRRVYCYLEDEIGASLRESRLLETRS